MVSLLEECLIVLVEGWRMGQQPTLGKIYLLRNLLKCLGTRIETQGDETGNELENCMLETRRSEHFTKEELPQIPLGK